MCPKKKVASLKQLSISPPHTKHTHPITSVKEPIQHPFPQHLQDTPRTKSGSNRPFVSFSLAKYGYHFWSESTTTRVLITTERNTSLPVSFIYVIIRLMTDDLYNKEWLIY